MAAIDRRVYSPGFVAAQRLGVAERQAVRDITVQRIVRRRLVGHDVGREAAARERGEDVGRVALERHGSGHAILLPALDALERLVEVVGALVDIARREPALDSGAVDLDHERNPAVHRDGERLGPTHAAEASRDDQPAGQAAPEVAPRELRERLVGALQDALRADVDPAAGGHLSVHREAAIFKIAETIPRRPRRHEQRIGDEHAGSPGMGAEDGDGLARLHDERLVVFEPAEGRDDGVERGPAACRPPRPAIDDEILGTFGDVGIEVVHQHAERGFLRPSLAGDRRASRRADMAAEDAHRAEVEYVAFYARQTDAVNRGCRRVCAEGSNLRTYARVVNLKLKNFLT